MSAQDTIYIIQLPDAYLKQKLKILVNVNKSYIIE